MLLSGLVDIARVVVWKRVRNGGAVAGGGCGLLLRAVVEMGNGNRGVAIYARDCAASSVIHSFLVGVWRREERLLEAEGWCVRGVTSGGTKPCEGVWWGRTVGLLLGPCWVVHATLRGRSAHVMTTIGVH